MVTAFYCLKPYVLLLYGTFGFGGLCVAGASDSRAASIARYANRGSLIGILFLTGAASLLLAAYIAVGSYTLLDATVIAAVVFLVRPGSRQTSKTVLGGLSTAVVVLSLVWWRFEPSMARPLPLAAFALVLAGLALGLCDPGRFRLRLVWLATSLFMAAGLALLIDLGAFRPSQASVVGLVHHWGAFIGPALHVKAGLVPFRDVPLQYGLGPTLAIAAACNGSDCWTGAEILFVGAHLIEGSLFLAMAFATQTRRGWPWIVTVTVVMFAAVFLWPGFPADGNALMETPSSGGIRFLPVTIVACLWFFGRPTAAMVAMVPALLWSPEVAAMTVAVSGLCGTALLGFRRAALLNAALLIGSHATLFLVHRMIFGVWIDPIAFVEYLLHVPGALPVNPFSDILLLAATLGLGGWLICNPVGNPQARRRDLAATALLFAVTSYTLGRSHPNNVCNLAPFLALVALRALDRSAETSGAVGKAASLGLAVSVAALAFSPWEVVPFDPHVVTDIHAVVSGFPAQEPDVARLRSELPQSPELGIADFGPHFARHPAETVVWTPMDPSSLWGFVPNERRKLYIERSARKLRRSGWAIFADYELFLLDDLKAAYDVSNVRFNEGAPFQPGGPPTRYTVACFDPKPEIVMTTIGPACPSERDGRLSAVRVP